MSGLKTIHFLKSTSNKFTDTRLRFISLTLVFRGRRRTNTRDIQMDDTDLVANEQLPESTMGDDNDSDTDSIPDLSAETGLKFHLKKKS